MTVASCIMPESLRQKLSADPNIGCGNFVHAAAALNPNRGETSIRLDRPFRAISGRQFESFSLVQLEQVCDDYAAFYHAAGVRERDLIAIYVEEGFSNYIHLVALSSLGAIPVLINGAMAPGAAAAYLRRVGVVGAYFGERQAEAIAAHLGATELPLVFTDVLAAQRKERSLPRQFPYVHHAEDVVVICHSSGTTGDSKAVFEQHGQFFEGTRRRLREGWFGDGDRVMSTLPHSHSAGITFFMAAVCSGTPLFVLGDYRSEVVLPQIEELRPTVVVGFTRTFAELAVADLARRDLSTVRRWINVGDAAHQKHIRELVQHGTRVVNGERVQGAEFVDGFGSTEMAFSLFQKVFTRDSDDYDRCVGKPHPIAEAAVIGNDGEILGPNRVGRLGVKSPSITRGYWNDSLLTCRSRVKGYWLTGDLVYRDGHGNYYHLDRVNDAVVTAGGPVYTLALEERLLMLHPDIKDASVLGLPRGEHAEVVGMVLLRPGSALGEAALLRLFNDDLQRRGLPKVARVIIADPNHPWPTGPTGKVVKRRLREQLLASEANVFGHGAALAEAA